MEDLLYCHRAIYERLPLPIRNSAGWILTALPQRIRYGSFYSVYRRRIAEFLDAGDTWQSKGLQLRLLQETVDSAVRHVPFYKGGTPIRDYADLKQFPIVSRDDYLRDIKAFTAEGLEAQALTGLTGGSCGNPMTYYVHKNMCRPKEKAHLHWFWGLHGYRPRSRILAIRGKPLRDDRLFDLQSLDNRLAVSCFELKDSNAHLVAAAVRRFKPEFVHAYPSSLKIFCQLVRDRDALGPMTELRAILLSSEILPEMDETLFAEFFGAPVVTWYGQSECVLHGGYLPNSAKYHFFPFYGYLELLDERDNMITQAGKVGRIVGTSFDNHVMPFLRYDTGDLGALSLDAQETSAWNWPVLERIEGRAQDIIYLSDGTPVTVASWLAAQRLPQYARIREMQLEQETAGKLLMRIVKGPGFQLNDEIAMIDRLSNSVSPKVQISTEYVDTIPKTHRGKHILLVQKMRDQTLRVR